MRELIAVAHNITLVKDHDNGWEGRAEVIVITSEPQYHLDEDGDLKNRRRACEVFRFMASEAQISGMIEGLEKLRFDLQSAGTATTLANQDAPKKKAA